MQGSDRRQIPGGPDRGPATGAAAVHRKGRQHMDFQTVIEDAGRAVNAAGVVIIVAGAAVATLVATEALLRRQTGTIYDVYRRRLGRSILLGLEFLVATDIISTVALLIGARNHRTLPLAKARSGPGTGPPIRRMSAGGRRQAPHQTCP